MSLTVGTVDIAVKLNTADFNQQVQRAVDYTTKAFNSINISKVLQGEFKQATNVVQQVTTSMASATQSAISSIMSTTDKSVSKTISNATKQIEKLEKELEKAKKDYAVENAGWEKDLYNARTNFAGGANSPQYNWVLKDADKALRPMEQKIEDINRKLVQQKRLLEDAINQAKLLDAQKQLSSAVSSATKTNSLISSITSQKQYNDLLEQARSRMELIEAEAQKISNKTGFSVSQLINQNAEYQKQVSIVDTLENNTEKIKNNILQTNIANQSQLSIWEQVQTSIDAVKNATSNTSEKVRSISLDNFSNTLETIGSKLSSMGGMAGKLGTVFTGIASTLSKFNPYILAASVALKAVWNGAIKVKDAVNETFDKIKDSASMVTSKIGSAIQSITGQSDNFEDAWSGTLNRLIVLMGSLFSINKMYSFIKESVTLAGDLESAWFGLATMADKTGNSFANAQKFITEYTQDGLVTIADAVTSYKTLISAKYTEQQAKDIMIAFKDTAAFGRQQGKTISQAVKDATEGIKNQNSVMTDNAGVTKNLSIMYREYAASIGTTEGKLTEAQKRMAIYEGMLKEAQLSQGNAARAADTFNGRLSRLSATFYNLKTAIGNVFIPVLNLIIPILNNILLALTRFFNGISNLLALIGLKLPDISSGLGGVSSGIAGVGDEATDTAKDIAGTGSAAKKAAKEINKAFANVDEINVLNFNKSDSSGSGSGGSGSGVGGLDAGGLAETTNPLAGANEKLNEFLKQSLEEKAKILADGINKALDSIDWEPIKAKAKLIATNITTFLNAFIKELDWTLIGYTIAEGLNTALTFVNTLLSTFDFFQLGASISIGLNSMIASIDWNLLGETIGNYFNSSIHFIEGFVTEFDWIGLGMSLSAGIKSTFDTIDWNALVYNVYTGINGVFSTIHTFVTTINWSNLGKEIAKKLNNLIAGIDWKALGKTVGDSWNAVWDTLWELVDNFDFDGLVDDVIETLNTFIETADFEKSGKTVGELLEKVLKAGIKLLEKVDWETALEDFLDGVDLAQLIVDYYKLKNDIWWAKVKIIGEIVMDAIWDGITGWFVNGAKDFGQYLWDHLVQPWIDTKDSIEDDKGLLEIGGNIVKGIFKGIKGILGAPLQLIKEYIFDPICSAIEVAFGIASPAKEMEPYGEYIVEGIFKGIGNIKDKAIKKWKEVKSWFTDPEVGLSAKWTTTKEDVTTWWNNTKSWWGDRKVEVTTWWKTTKSNVDTWWNSTKSWWGTKKLELTTWWKTTKSNVNSWWTQTKSWWGTKSVEVSTKWTTTKNIVNSWWSQVQGWWGNRTLTISAKISDITANLKNWINTNFIDKVNSKLPSWLGKIPRLATGGYVGANNPQLAIVGDNKREGEIVAPESKIYEQTSKAIKDSNNETKNQKIDLVIELRYPDGKTMIKEINSTQIKEGKVLLIT